MKKKQIIFLICMIAWMIIIFCFSARPGDLSGEDSHRIGWLIGRTFIKGFETWSAERQSLFVTGIDFAVRKAAHATEYAILGLFAAGTIGKEKLSKWSYLLPVLIAGCYAVTDELHQLFVLGRACRFTDVLIDTAGAAAAVGLLRLIQFICVKRRNNY